MERPIRYPCCGGGRSGLRAVGAQSGARTNPREGCSVRRALRNGARGLFKDNGGVKFSAGPSLVTRRFCDEKVQGLFGWNERAEGEVMGNQAK